MLTVIGVRFKKAGKIYYFDPDNIDTENAKHVIVETARGIEFGNLVIPKRQLPDDQIVSPLKKVIRVATEEDIQAHAQNQTKKKEAYKVCLEKIKAHKLEMKLIDVEYTFDNNKVIFYFTSDGRVDFRELVKDLAGVFRTRIELRQIGVRDEAKMLNGIGSCGCGLCCANWLGDFEPVSIKMAKDQNLSLNPTKISGICGRLMCCLKYEHDVYLELNKDMPREGEMVNTPDGKAVVYKVQIIRELVKVRLVIGEDNGDLQLDEDISTYKKNEIERLGKGKKRPRKPNRDNSDRGKDLGEKEGKPSSKSKENQERPKKSQDRSKKSEKIKETRERPQKSSGKNKDKQDRPKKSPNPNKDRPKKGANQNKPKQDRPKKASDKKNDHVERPKKTSDRKRKPRPKADKPSGKKIEENKDK